MPVYESLCKFCANLSPVGLSCTAFPDRIPDAILDGYDHRKPFPGDNGIRFVLEPGEERRLELYDERHRRALELEASGEGWAGPEGGGEPN